MGLGQATAMEAAKEGARLSLVDLNADALAQAKQEIAAKHPNTEVLTVVADVSKEADVQKYVDETFKLYKRIDDFYNNAGIECKQALIPDYDVNVFKKVIDINLLGVYYGMRYTIPIMKKQQYGRIVNTASVGGIRGVINQVPYVASKHAVSGMTKNAEMEFAQGNPTKRLGLPEEVAKGAK